jgi:hypothetical protein
MIFQYPWMCPGDAFPQTGATNAPQGGMLPRSRNHNVGALAPKGSAGAITATSRDTSRLNAANQGKRKPAKHTSKTTWIKKKTCREFKKR